MTGRLIAIVGPSGVGKDSVMQAMVMSDPDLRCVRRVITRAGAAADEDCESVSLPEFRRLAAADSFLLHWQAHGLHYGIRSRVVADLQAGLSLLVNLSRSVLTEAQDKVPDLVIISLTASDEVLAARLKARARESDTEQVARLERAAFPLPDGLRNVHVIDNSGSMDATIAEFRTCLYPERV